MHEVFSSLLKIFGYAAKHASSCSAIRPNYQSQPQLMAFTRVYAKASLLSAYTNENRGGHIYTVIQTHNPVFQVTTFLKSNISKLTEKVTIAP